MYTSNDVYDIGVYIINHIILIDTHCWAGWGESMVLFYKSRM